MLTAIRSGKILLPERIDFMELKDTIELMQSTDYKDRFKAEYYQLIERYKKTERNA